MHLDVETQSRKRGGLAAGFGEDLDHLESRSQVLDAKLHNKQRLAELVRRELGLPIDPHSLFDVHIRRIHEYKRQLLNVLHVIARFQVICAWCSCPTMACRLARCCSRPPATARRPTSSA
ncbi:Maltodextrin phosphorylase [Enhygromyxa salina]|uniref:Alpha-1,4 glucan phosphorylase n=1 Tax=Enhygromyxa salina TaxID=215803 RepID=A0A2S9YFV9_9BACT|nr:glycogen/starch/alpha-glucan phosphorylase [Enhygromyxa salina]PRQ03988.1 Maltodextrin phosphorylase [Enhygromyxa salina]